MSIEDRVKQRIMDKLRKGGGPVEEEEPATPPPPPPADFAEPSEDEHKEGKKHTLFHLMDTAAKKYEWLKDSAKAVKKMGEDFEVSTYFDQHEDWDKWVVNSVPKLDSDSLVNFKPHPEALYQIMSALEDGHSKIVGDPGSGKTTFTEFAAALTGRPYMMVAFHAGIEREDFIEERDIVAEDGVAVTKYNQHDLPRFIRYPSIVDFDEFHGASAAAALSIQQLLNSGNPKLPLSDGYVVPNKEFRALLTDNTYGLGDGLDKYRRDVADLSTLDRMDASIDVPYLDQKMQINLVMAWYPEIQVHLARKIVQFGEKCMDAFRSGELPLPFTPRSLKSVCAKTVRHRNPIRGIKMGYYGFLPEKAQREHVKLVLNEIGFDSKYGKID